MTPKLTPSTIALAFSASATVCGNSISSAGEEVNSPERPIIITGTSIPHRSPKVEISYHSNLLLDGGDIDVDVGILAENNDGAARHHDNKLLFQRRSSGGFRVAPRFLQEEVPTCSYPETCEPNLCACTANGGNGYECAAEINAVCNKVTDVNGTVWTLDGCVGNLKYYRKVICPFAKCIVEGGTYGTCYCQQYQTVCDIYGDRQKYENDTTTVQSCAAAACCQAKTDEDGRKSCFVEPSSKGQSIFSLDSVRATSSLAVAAVACSILC